MTSEQLNGIKVLMVIAPTDFRDEELLEPQQLLTEAGATVVVASTKSGEAKGMLGARVTPALTLADVKSADYNAVVVVGGMGSPTHLWANTQLHKIISDLHHAGKIVSGICLSGAVLANAGVLRGKKATVWPTAESLQALKEGKADYVKNPVVHDGNVITANGPEAATEFGRNIITALKQVVTHA